MNDSMLNAASRVVCAIVAGALILMAARADAAVVSGVYISSGGTPIADHQLHFQNRISGDMFLVRTGTDGSFASDLPPGVYDLRGERGLVIKSGIRVDGPDFDLGHISKSTALNLLAPFELQGVRPPLITTAAPATAHLQSSLATSDPAATSPSASSPAVSSASPNTTTPTVQPIQ
jgi:hypothetical protein